MVINMNENTQTPPEINRDEPEGVISAKRHEYDVPPPKKAKAFKDLFPERSIHGEIIHNFLFSPDDIYERIMGVCMLLTLLAAFNPVLIGINAVAYGIENVDFLRIAFLLALAGGFLFCTMWIKRSYPVYFLLPITILKMFFREGVGDIFLALAFMATVYLMFRVKERKDAILAEQVLAAAKEMYGEEFTGATNEKE
ncbi:MAG: hypothetical protein FWG45_00135 [Oscillospiraceae bacterium]|nr:hypothetical protein [Oscillospiraceae bacterium]